MDDNYNSNDNNDYDDEDSIDNNGDDDVYDNDCDTYGRNRVHINTDFNYYNIQLK